VVIPCMYTVMDDLTQNLRRLVAPRRAAVKQRVAGGE
jgi:hypothetical protein